MPQRYVLDFETFSECDLKRSGAWQYSTHPSTEILCAVIKTPNGELETFINDFSKLKKLLSDPSTIWVAHNSIFEQCIVRNVLKVNVPSSRWLCTASLSRALALPGSLEKVCLALNLSHQKNVEGHRLMLKMSKPRKPSKHNPSTRHTDPEDTKKLANYCADDVRATEELYSILPPLNINERAVWFLDQDINFRGFNVDTELVDGALFLIEKEKTVLDKETRRITDGTVSSTRQRDVTLKWIGKRLPDLRSKTVADTLLRTDLTPNVRRILEIRQAVSMSSTKKYQAFRDRTDAKGVCRDNLVYHAASTGRWGGTGVQPQNFPRGFYKELDLAIDFVKEGNIEAIRELYGEPMKVFSSLLRSCIVPRPNTLLFCGDFNSIETRVLFWIANHEKGLKAYERKEDLYKKLAVRIYNKALSDITKSEREVGKRGILGCGYGMGANKFGITCAQYGEPVSKVLAKRAVDAYRTEHAPVKSLWSNLERAAIAAVRNKRKRYTINHTKWFMDKKFLFCELPSGRRLSYYDPRIEYEDSLYGPQEKLYHYGQNSITKKWELDSTYGGKLTENVVQAVARDLMAESMLRIRNSFDIILTVHDEILAEGKPSQKLEDFLNTMKEVPSWAKGMPIEVEGWVGDRYHK